MNTSVNYNPSQISEDFLKLKSVADKSQRVLYKTQSVFPFNFFPDSISIENDRVEVICNQGPASEWVHSIQLDNITNVTIESGPFFSTLELTDSTNPRNIILIKVQNLSTESAFKARALIEGLKAARRENVDLDSLIRQPEIIEDNSLRNELVKLGEFKQGGLIQGESALANEFKIPHYYGDIIRLIFIIAAVFMLIVLPIFKDTIPFPLTASVFSIMLIGLLAGLTNPRIIIVTAFDTICAVSGFIIFEYIAVSYFDSDFWYAFTNQILAILLFISLYYSTKTLRAFFLSKSEKSLV